jgi:hypothetical protein
VGHSAVEQAYGSDTEAIGGLPVGCSTEIDLGSEQMMDDFILEICDECECYPCQCDDDGDEREYCFTCNIPCECGGDLCACLNNGEMPCPDCEL